VNPAPTVASISPGSVVAGSPAQTLTFTGTGYISSTTANLNGTALQTKYVSATSMQVVVPASALAAGQVVSFVLSNPTPGGGNSAASNFSIMSPTPAVTRLSPQSVPQGTSATVTVNGSGFEANSVVLWNGQPRVTTFVSGTTLQVALTAADLQSYGTGQISVNNPGPGGSNTTPTELEVAANVPTIISISPSIASVNTSSNVPTFVSIYGSGFAANATVQANGQFIPVTTQSGTNITVSLPSSFFVSAGSIQFAVSNPGTPVVQSNTATLTVSVPNVNFYVSPNYAAAGSPDTTITVSGNGFFKDSVVEWNNTPLNTTYVSSNQLTAIIPAALISGFVQASIQVSTPETQAQAMPPQPFTTFLPLPINDIVYNSVDGLIYASIAGSAGEGLGNTIAGIDPNSAVVVKTIFVGSEPNRLALSSDGTQLFFGLNGSGTVRQVNLTTGIAGTSFSLGGGPGVYNAPYTATGLAALPGQPNSVAVSASNGVIAIFDSGVARAKTTASLSTVGYIAGYGAGLSFGNSASTLYTNSLYALTIDATGVTAAKSLNNGGNNSSNNVQYDNGRLYMPTGTVFDASTGNQLGQFSAMTQYSNVLSAVSGPIVSDSTLGRAWVVPSYTASNTNQVLAFDETTFNPTGSLSVTGIGTYPSNSFNTNPSDLIRWGENGLAFHTASQLYVLQGPVVKDISNSPADLSVSIQAPTNASTGTEFSYTVQVANLGPNAAQGVVITTVLPASVIGGTVTPSQGSCSGGSILYCDLGTIANASTASIAISVTPTVSGTLGMTASSSSVSFDPASSNNQTTASTIVTGNAFNAQPSVTQLSPTLVVAGSSTLTLTVDGTGFTSGSAVLWNGQALPTTFVSGGQMTATVDSSLIQQLGWAQVSVTTPAPGGGQSSGLPLHIYQVLNVPANAINFDAFTQKLYAVLPSSSTSISGNSIVAIDPTNGSVGSPIQVGSEPNVLSETSDGKYLFIGLSGAKSLGRFNLLTQTLDLTVPLNSTSIYNSGEVAALNIATVPGSDSSLAVEISSNGGIGIFDITGSTGTFRNKLTQIYAGNNPVFADATHFYAYDANTSGAEFYRYSIDASGATLIDGTTLNGMGGFGGRFALDGGLVFGSGGGIVNPNTTPPSQVATLPLGSGPYNLGLSGGGVVPYQSESKAFVIGVNTAGTAANYLERFDTHLFTLEQQIQLPGGSITSISGTRWGQDGLAYLLPTSTNGISSTNQIFLLRGPFILPAEAVTNSAPSLTSADQTTITAGSSNLYLTVTGTGFLPGAVVLWNGSPRTTSFIDATHLQVAIPASDLTSAATITLTSQNPGSTSSNSLFITVQ
jgi:trimeric autotransporter adhesin